MTKNGLQNFDGRSFVNFLQYRLIESPGDFNRGCKML